MTDTRGLYALAESAGIPIIHFPLPQTGSLSIQTEDMECFIGMDEAILLRERDKKVHLAHELGHCMTGSFYNRYASRDFRGKRENQADKWAVEHLISPEELDNAVAVGCTDLWSLAEHFSVTEEFMRKVVCWYTHGNLAAELYF